MKIKITKVDFIMVGLYSPSEVRGLFFMIIRKACRVILNSLILKKGVALKSS